MSIATATNKIQYANPTGSAYEIDFPFFAASEIRAILSTPAGDIELALSTDFTLTDPGISGTLTKVSEWDATATRLTIYREIPISQDVDLANGDKMDANVLERMHDRSTAIMQQLKEMISRQIMIPVTDEDASLEVPAKTARASKWLGFDSDGNLMVGSLGLAPATPGDILSMLLLLAKPAPNLDADKIDGKHLAQIKLQDLSEAEGDTFGRVAKAVSDALNTSPSSKILGLIAAAAIGDTTGATTGDKIANRLTSDGYTLTPATGAASMDGIGDGSSYKRTTAAGSILANELGAIAAVGTRAKILNSLLTNIGSINLFDPSDADIDLGHYYTTGNVRTANALFNTTGYIPVVAGELYTALDKDLIVHWYTASKTHLSYTETFTSPGYATAPATAAYARFCGRVSTWATYWVNHGATGSYSAFRIRYESDSDIIIPAASLLPKSITAAEISDSAGFKAPAMSFLSLGSNLFDPTDADILVGYYYSNSNVLTAAAAFNTTGYIPVTAGSRYTALDKDLVVHWYNAYKVHTGFTYSSTFQTDGYVTAPAGSYFARFCGRAATWDGYWVNAGSAGAYERFGYIFPSLITRNSGLDGKKWTSFGDSITNYGLWQLSVARHFGLVHTNLGVPATALGGAVNATYPCFWEPARILAVKNSDPDILTILGGANDQAHHIFLGNPDTQFAAAVGSKDCTTFYGAYSFIIETLLAWKPALRIFLLTTTWGSVISVPDGTTGLTCYDYAEATRQVGKHYGLPVADLAADQGVNAQTYTLLLADTIHPNSVGAARISSLVKSKIESAYL